jgi:hypothetical protein
MDSDQAETALEMFDAWLTDVETACEMAWDRSGVGHDRDYYRQPLQLLRQLLSDLKSGEPVTWISPTRRASGDRSDKRFVKALKDRAAQTVAFLEGHGIDKAEAAEAVASLVSRTMKTFPLARNPLPTGGTLSRRAAPALPAALRAEAERLLRAYPEDGSLERGQRVRATIAALMAEPMTAYFQRPRPKATVK